MAFTVKLQSNQKCFLKGDTFKLTATLESSEALPQNLVYTWTKDGTPVEGTGNTISIKNANEENGGKYKVSVTSTDAPDAPAVDSNPLTISMAELIVKLDKQNQYVEHGEATTINASVAFSTGFAPTDNYTINYAWKRDGTDLSVSTQALEIPAFTDDNNGMYTCHTWGESKQSEDVAQVKLLAISMSPIENLPLEKIIPVGKPILLPYKTITTVIGDERDMPGLSVKQSWYLQREGQREPTLIGSDTGEAIEGFTIMPNGYLYKEAATHDDHANYWCIAELLQTISSQQTKILETGSAHCQVNVVESLYKMHRYVHPIPWRKTSFMYIGWWVFDEIVTMNENGLDWREHFSDSRYAPDIETIAGAEEKYHDCILMESRNGFMYNASKLHHLSREVLEKVLKIRERPPL